MSQTASTIHIEFQQDGQITIDGKAVAGLEAAQAVITDNATKTEVPMLKITAGSAHVVEVGKLISSAHWAGYPGDKIDARAWE